MPRPETAFEAQLRRLKECLQVEEDQQVAEILGMTKASLSDRKRRGSFPEERVVGLVAQRPEIDVVYVLTGERASTAEAASLIPPPALVASLPANLHAGIAEAIKVHAAEKGRRAPRVQVLVDLLHWCTDEDLELLIRVAARLGATGGRQRASEIEAAKAKKPT